MDFLASDAGRSLGMRFANWDGSDGWTNFLVSRGVTISMQQLYFRMYAHCTIQAACTDATDAMRRSITQGALSGFSSHPEGYNFEATYSALGDAYRGRFPFQHAVEQLSNRDAPLHYLLNPYVGIINAKYLIESFIVPYMQNADAFLNDFTSYSSPMGASIGTVRRASNYISKSFKIAAP